MLIQMKIRGMMFDPLNNSYIVILRDESNSEILPIWVGKAEANAISLAIEGVLSARPLTHDLIKNILDSLNATVISCVITDLKENTYYSKLHLMFHDSEFTIDARPSDSIALCLKTEAPIFTSEEVLKKHSTEELDRWLDNIRPEDFGKYDA
jgi:bifunctional DNase/RNase